MKKPVMSELSLKETEAQVLVEGREWTRQRLEQRLQAQAGEAGALFPPAPTPDALADAAHRGRRGDRRGSLRSRSTNG